MSSKLVTHLFDTLSTYKWAKSLPKEQRERFNNLVKYLSELNGIAVVKDYETHVYQCFN